MRRFSLKFEDSHLICHLKTEKSSQTFRSVEFKKKSFQKLIEFLLDGNFSWKFQTLKLREEFAVIEKGVRRIAWHECDWNYLFVSFWPSVFFNFCIVQTIGGIKKSDKWKTTSTEFSVLGRSCYWHQCWSTLNNTKVICRTKQRIE